MTFDAGEKESLVRQAQRMGIRQPLASASGLALREGDVSEGPQAEHPVVEQGPGGDPEAGTRRGPAIPDPDLEPAAQVCAGAADGGLREGREGRSQQHSARRLFAKNAIIGLST
jgi:hypothetical protein